jgi:hypothetical protein
MTSCGSVQYGMSLQAVIKFTKNVWVNDDSSRIETSFHVIRRQLSGASSASSFGEVVARNSVGNTIMSWVRDGSPYSDSPKPPCVSYAITFVVYT